MLSRVFALVALPGTLLCQQAKEDSLNSALVWRDSVSFFFTPPAGWLFNSKEGADQGTLAVIYRTGESWSSGPAVMYAAMYDLPSASQAALAKKVESEVAEWKQKAGDATITVLPDLTVEGHAVPLRKFVSPSHNAYEVVAYYWQLGGAPVLALSARSEADYQRAFADFLKLARSYAKGPKVQK